MRKRLQHPNIVPFIGALTETLPLKIVCEWMEHGKITEYVRQHPNVDRVDLVRELVTALVILFQRKALQLWDIAEGLHYLHSYNIAHGDLKGVSCFVCLCQILTSTHPKANVPIDRDGHARLTDFGLTSTVQGNQSVVTLPGASKKMATTWAAPEISDGGPVTKAGDIFAFAMVVAEVRERGFFVRSSPQPIHMNRRLRSIL